MVIIINRLIMVVAYIRMGAGGGYKVLHLLTTTRAVLLRGWRDGSTGGSHKSRITVSRSTVNKIINKQVKA